MSTNQEYIKYNSRHLKKTKQNGEKRNVTDTRSSARNGGVPRATPEFEGWETPGGIFARSDMDPHLPVAEEEIRAEIIEANRHRVRLEISQSSGAIYLRTPPRNRNDPLRSRPRRRMRETNQKEAIPQQGSDIMRTELDKRIRNCFLHGAGCPQGLYEQDIATQENATAFQQGRRIRHDNPETSSNAPTPFQQAKNRRCTPNQGTEQQHE